MPIYEYRCHDCGHHLEVIQKMGARPLRKCSECSGRLEKLISRTSFHLKGGGWYDEGYSKDGKDRVSKTSDGESAASKPASSPKIGKKKKKQAAN